MRDFAMKRLIPLWIGFAAYVAMFAIVLTAEASLSRGNALAVVLLALGVAASVAHFTLIRAMLAAYGFSWLRLVVLLLVPVIPFAFLAVVTWKKVDAIRHGAT
jgi:hypothetical protein